MNKNIIKDSISCLENVTLEDTTYKIAINITLDYLKELEEEHKELVETNYNLATKKTELEKELNELRSDYSMVVTENKKLKDKPECNLPQYKDWWEQEQEDKRIEKIDISNFPKRNNSLKKAALKINEIIDKINKDTN